jgi:hypothetical protein
MDDRKTSLELECGILNVVLWFFILGNIVNIAGYYVWENINHNSTIVALCSGIFVAIITGILAFQERNYKSSYLAYLAISFVCSYIPYYLIVRYTGGSSLKAFAMSGLIYNIIVGGTIILNKCEAKKTITAIVGIVATLIVFGLVALGKNSSLVTALLGYNPDTFVSVKWADLINIIALYYLCISIIQYVAIFTVKDDSRASRILVISFVAILGVTFGFFLVIISEGGALDCGGDCLGADCGGSSGGSDDRRNQNLNHQ